MIGNLVLIAVGLVVGFAIAFEAITVNEAIAGSAIAIGVWFIAYLVIMVTQTRKFVADSTSALAMLGRGDLEKAAAIWTRWASSRLSTAAVRTPARHNVAWTTLRRGHLREALEQFAANEKTGLRWLKAGHLHGVSALDRALCSALLGDLGAARHALAEATQRAAPANPAFPPMHAFVRAVVACREARHGEAANELAEQWAEYESQAPGDLLRPMRVVRAFAMAAEGPRSAGQVETMVAGCRPSYPGEYDFLAGSWPELAAFLDSHQLRR